MHRLYQKLKDWDLVLVLLVLLTLAKELRYFFHLFYSPKGFPYSEDSQWYLNYAHAVIANFSDGLDMNDVLYLGYNLLLALLLAIFKEPVAVIFLQALTAGLGVILVYRIAQRLFNRTTAVLASLFYCASWEITQWAMYILSDSFFTSLLLLCVYWLLLAVELPDWKYRVGFGVAALVLLFFRPTGLVMLAMMAVYVLMRVDAGFLVGYLKRYRLWLGGLLTVAAVAGVYLYNAHHLDPLLASLQFNAKKVLYNIYAKGWVYDKPTAHDYFFRSDYQINICDSLVLSYIVNNWHHVLIVYGKRAIAFLGSWIWSTDLNQLTGILHFLKNMVPFGLFSVGTVAAMRDGRFSRASILWLVVFGVLAFCVLVFIDAMYRYRLPAIPFIAIIAAYGAERLWNGLMLLKVWGCK
ncbi:MAG TPA: glycosyltransferase family 39 protein [Patescibacteria group bacterium]|nr:glycosyltransferase family 39 protein [Patescibacteria group bacterium]